MAELERLARAIAAIEGWEVDAPTCKVRGEPPREVRVAVSGGRLPGRCLLRVRDRRPEGEAGRAELDARAAAASEHVVGVRVEHAARRVRGREVDAVVLDFPEHGDLEALLAREDGLRSGEAATILLGVAGGLESLHRSGWAGPELTGAGVVFLGDGCPALDALDQLEPLTAEGAVTDAEHFYDLARTVCLRVTDGFGMRLLAAVESGLRGGRWSGVADSVLRVVAPEPVALGDAGPPGARRRAPTGADDAEVHTDSRDSPRRGSGPGAVVGRFGGVIGALVSRAMDQLDGRPGRALGERLRALLRRRPALVAAAAVPVVAALALVALLPTPSPERSPGSATSEAPVSMAGANERTGAAESASSPASTPASTPASSPASPPVASPTGSPVPASAAAPAADADASAEEPGQRRSGLESEDPVDAARAVLDARHSCFVARTPRSDCLTGVLDDGSPFVAEETSALGAKGSAGERDYDGARLSLVERWGGAALVSAAPDTSRTPESEPASLLLVRSEAGWRLRAVYP